MDSEDIHNTFLNVFDQDFYNQYYGCSSTSQNFWEDNKLEGKFINRCIVNDNFDYGLFVSKLNWNNISIDTEYRAIQYFLLRKNSYHQWFKDKNTSCELLNHSININNMCCIYVAYLNSEVDLAIAINSIDNILSDTENIKIITLGHINFCKIINEKYKDKITTLTKPYDLIRYIKKYNYCLYINNNNCICSSLQNFIKQGMHSNADVFSIHDKYNITYNNKYYYGINTDCMIMKRRTAFKILKCIIKNTSRTSFYINKLLFENNITYSCLLYINLYKEIFWQNLFSFDILDYRHIIKKHEFPLISKKLYKISRLNVQHCVLKPEIVNCTGRSIIDKFLQYKNDKHTGVACHIHIGNLNGVYINDIKKYIDEIQKLGIDLFVTSIDIIPNIDSYVIPNIGADIGPFLYILDKYILDNNKYNYILKFHSKSHHGFRHMCFDSILNQLDYSLYLLENQRHSAIAGLIDHNVPMDDINKSKMNEFCNRYNINTNYNFNFFAGTMFIYKLSVIKSFIKKYKINLSEEHLSLEYGYTKNHRATKTHTWERILSGLIPHKLTCDKIYI